MCGQSNVSVTKESKKSFSITKIMIIIIAECFFKFRYSNEKSNYFSRGNFFITLFKICIKYYERMALIMAKTFIKFNKIFLEWVEQEERCVKNY